jgi:c-di-GMP-binding flagellar brake protein YcgR
MPLRVKQGVTLFSPDLMGGEKLQALIHEITPDHIVLHIPFENIGLAKDLDIIIGFWDDNASYEFPSRTLSTKDPGNTLVAVTRPTVLSKKINRVYSRVDLNSEGEIWKDNEKETHTCLVKDLSAGGARITAQSMLAVQDAILIDIPTKEKVFAGLSGRIVWKRDIQGQPGVSEYGIQFEKISQIRRNELDSFIMKNSRND